MSDCKDEEARTEEAPFEGLSVPYSNDTVESQQSTCDGSPHDEDDDPEEKARVERYQSKAFFERYFLEFILFLYTLATNLYITPLGTLISEKLCVYKYHYDGNLCQHLENATESIKNPILDDSQVYGSINDAFMNIPGALAALISGKYLTRYGFRAPLILTLGGGMVSCLCQLATVFVMPAPVYLNALAELPGSITGGSVLMLSATYSHVALQVPRSLHLERIMMVSVFAGVGLLIGILSGGALATVIGMKWLTISCVALLMVPTLLIIVYFEDIEVPPENKNDSWREALWLSTKHGFSTAMSIIMEKRPQRKRAQITATLMCSFCAFFGLAASNGPVAFSYARSVLNFNQTEYGLWNGIGLVLLFILVFPLLAVVRKLKVSHPVVIAGGSVFFMLKFGMLTITEFIHFLFYLQLFVGIPFFVSLISMRAYLTELLEVSEVPVVMALLAAIERIVPVISGLVTTSVYHFTNTSFPGCVFLLMTINYIIPINLGLYCRMILKWNSADKQKILA